MSLINKMLQDLEARQDSNSSAVKPVYQDLRPIRPASPGSSRRLLIVLVGMAVVASSLYVAVDQPLVKEWYGVATSIMETKAPATAAPELPAAPAATSVAVADARATVVESSASAPPLTDQVVMAAAPVVTAPSETPPAAAPVPPPATASLPLAVDTAPAKSTPTAPAAPLPTEKPKTPAPKPKPVAKLPVNPPVVDSVPTPSPEAAVVDKRPHAQTPEEKAQAAYHEAARLLERGRPDEAMRELRQLLTAQPTHVKARELAAAIALQNGRAPESEKLLADGIRLVPQHYGFAQMLARVHAEHGADAKALAVLESAAPHAGDDPDFNALLGAMYQRAGRHGDAVKVYQRVLTQRAGDGRAWLGLAISLEATQQWSNAADAYRRARESGGLTVALTRYADGRLAAINDR